MVDDGQPPAEPVGLLHVVRGEDDGDAAALQRGDGVPQHAAGLRVEAGGGLVEEQHARVVHERARDHRPLLHAAGQGQRLRPRLVGELHLRQQAVGAGFPLRGGEAEVAAVVDEQLAHGEVAVEVAGLGDHGDQPLRVLRARHHVDAVDGHPARGRPHEGGDAAEGRALAGAVGAEQAEGLPRLDGEGDAAHGLHRRRLPRRGVGLDQVLDDQDGRHQARPAARRRPRPGRP